MTFRPVPETVWKSLAARVAAAIAGLVPAAAIAAVRPKADISPRRDRSKLLLVMRSSLICAVIERHEDQRYTLYIYDQLRTCKCLDIPKDIEMPANVDQVFFADCAARSFFDQVANKWSVMILTVLEEKPTRFNELMRRLDGITHKALTQALRRLERNGLILRKVLATSPVAVEYSITDLGRTLQVPFGAVYEWAINHLGHIEEAQAEYDARAAI